MAFYKKNIVDNSREASPLTQASPQASPYLTNCDTNKMNTVGIWGLGINYTLYVKKKNNIYTELLTSSQAQPPSPLLFDTSVWIAVKACLDCLPERLWGEFVQFVQDQNRLIGICEAIEKAAVVFGIHTQGIEAL